MLYNEKYMRRALELAAHGMGNTSPNPMVGAVIVGPDGRIIGEGYHRRCGEGHAEVNAVASVKDKSLLKDSTMYVTLEPCSHYGKTPPCAKLIIDSGIPRVVVGATDPFPEVSGRGIHMLRDAGIEVVDGVLAQESVALNRRFMTAHTQARPFVTLKWAQSADDFMDSDRPGGVPHRFSGHLGSTLVHRLRSLHDAILIGSGTALADNPRLDCRLWPGRSPRPVVVDRSHKLDLRQLRMQSPIILDSPDVPTLLKDLYTRGITSVLVEGGSQMLQSFIDSGLWDIARVEVSPEHLAGHGRIPAPIITLHPDSITQIGKNKIFNYTNNYLA
ncbi:MAG: bifunctional diaminohydroxyphosphoribosylaminopyrimidine deaminase/5-amino-6-(5-phosphoribosylamino)uracil reductase RibD [Muribaculaceae bacterium]|nr:bifunctional diaminohydroxyphosphoribosylaminopyrimidine deaminase/5-amino-6-(5-phosphoribosylamino)uracil reductase RibD [Muribaculaceae bacterium]